MHRIITNPDWRQASWRNHRCPHQVRWGWAQGPPRACQRHNRLRWRVEVTPGCTELLVLKLDGDILLLGAPPVHLSDLTNVPVVVALMHEWRTSDQLEHLVLRRWRQPRVQSLSATRKRIRDEELKSRDEHATHMCTLARQLNAVLDAEQNTIDAFQRYFSASARRSGLLMNQGCKTTLST